MVRHLWRHDIWISEKSKIDFLKNDKSFSEMKDPFYLLHKSSVKWQKGESRSACFKKKKTKHAKFSEKRTFLTPWHAHMQISKQVFQENSTPNFPKNEHVRLRIRG